MMTLTTPDGVEIRGASDARYHEVLSREALEFVADLHRTFDGRRRGLLDARGARQAAFDAGEQPGFLAETASVRAGDWRVAPPPHDLQDRRVEITGPVDRKMVINALNSGARVFMADFEDSHAPTWSNTIEGQLNLKDAVAGDISFTNPDGRVYELAETTATLVVRPRGWHLTEKHIFIDGARASASLVDFGLYFFHNARRLIANGTGPYFYLPKLESHLEARLWNDVFIRAQTALAIPRGTIKATVLIETILAAFEMDEILYELRDHSSGLNAGRWDYIFSIIKKFRNRSEFLLPDRGEVGMTAPFMRAYSELLVKTCHRRGAHAMGGMAAFIPSRKDEDVNARAYRKVREDKRREANDGFDGTWVAHPDLVPVAREIFDEVLGDSPNQVARGRDDVTADPVALVTVDLPVVITEEGLRNNVSVGLLYIEAWLGGRGAVALYNLMEDAATAEISRSQIWQWVRHRAELTTGEPITRDLVMRVISEELEKIREFNGDAAFARGRFKEARAVFEEVALSEDFDDFLTIPAYEIIQ